jgi:DNA-binding Lrp family transcriptional regulator
MVLFTDKQAPFNREAMYKAILDPSRLGRGATAFVLVTFEHLTNSTGTGPSQRDVAKEIAKLKEVQEVHIITGDWDLLNKKFEDLDIYVAFREVMADYMTRHGVTDATWRTSRASSTATPTTTRTRRCRRSRSPSHRTPGTG